MTSALKAGKLVAFFSCLLGCLLLTGPALAEEAAKDNPLQFYKDPSGSYVKATLQTNLAFFGQGNSWFDESEANLGEKSDNWWEYTVVPGMEGSYFTGKAGEVYARASAVAAGTDGYDAANSNNGEESISKLRMEDAYLGWRSGDLFSSLGKDFLDISFGRQQYVAGNGFLFQNESQNSNKRGAFWLGSRKAADYAALVRVKTGGFSGDLLYLKADDKPDSHTKAAGVTLDYAFEKLGGIGGGYYNLDSDIDARDGMNIYDARFSLTPFALFEGLDILKPFKLEAEYVYEDTDSGFDTGNGWYVSAGYQFDSIPWKPTLTYRYASFDEDYDPLFYGFNDWGNWYQGEILGEYVLSNSNLDSHMIRLNFSPLESVNVNLFVYDFKLHNKRAFGVSSDDYAMEYDLTVDWTVNDHLMFSVVGALADPDDGAEEQTGGDDNWTYMMLSTTISF